MSEKEHQDFIEIDDRSLSEKGFLTNANVNRGLLNEIRQVKRKIISNAFDAASQGSVRHKNIVMLSSVADKEGKTFMSINLALCAALEQEKTVLLIDANVEAPSVVTQLEFPDTRKGLIDYLSGEVENLSEVIVNTSIKNLKIIPAGKSHLLTSELLASDKMKELAQELSTRYPDRLVIVDSPSFSKSSETKVLTKLVGQLLIVCTKAKTEVEEIKRFVELLPQELEVGVILNKVY